VTLVTSGAGTVTTGVWHHIAITRQSGVVRVFRDGVNVITYNDTTNLTVGVDRPMFGKQGTAGTYHVHGYISDIRIWKGVAKYTSNFTRPSTSNDNLDNSLSLLLRPNPSIYDSTGRNAIETVGNARVIGGPVYPAYTSRHSHYFDGSGDYLNIPGTSDFDFGSGDFTIETWAYISGNSAVDNSGTRKAQIIGCFRGSPSQGWAIYINGNGTTTGTGVGIELYNAGVFAATSQTFSIPQQSWQHIAVTRNGGIVRIFLNGVKQGSDATFTSNLDSLGNNVWVGAYNVTGWAWNYNGYYHDLRVTKDVARYTANFAISRLYNPLPTK
jgi:hypothetical protein